MVGIDTKLNVERAEEYRTKGYFVVPGIISPESIPQLILECENAKDSDQYLDSRGKLRRIERIYGKGRYLEEMSQNIMTMLHEVFSEDVTIFKDKYITKPPGGEGYFVHYDGIFSWKDAEGNDRQGWHEYAPDFFNVAVALDVCDVGNGTLEIADKHELSFAELLSRTKMNGTPEILAEEESKLTFRPLTMMPGDGVIFSHKCPHRSAENKGDRDRRITYYTYNRLSAGDHYEKYFSDKALSNNGTGTSKALSQARKDD